MKATRYGQSGPRKEIYNSQENRGKQVRLQFKSKKKNLTKKEDLRLLERKVNKQIQGNFLGGPVVKTMPSNLARLCHQREGGLNPWSGNKDPVCFGATRPTCHNYRAHAPQLESLCATTTEPTCHNKRSHVLQLRPVMQPKK